MDPIAFHLRVTDLAVMGGSFATPLLVAVLVRREYLAATIVLGGGHSDGA